MYGPDVAIFTHVYHLVALRHSIATSIPRVDWLSTDPRVGVSQFSHTMAFPEVSTSKPKLITQDAIMNMMHQTINVGMKTYPTYQADFNSQLVVQRRRHAPRSPKSWPVSLVLDLDP